MRGGLIVVTLLLVFKSYPKDPLTEAGFFVLARSIKAMRPAVNREEVSSILTVPAIAP